MTALSIVPHLSTPPGEVREAGRGHVPRSRSANPSEDHSSAKETAVSDNHTPPSDSLHGVRGDDALLTIVGTGSPVMRVEPLAALLLALEDGKPEDGA